MAGSWLFKLAKKEIASGNPMLFNKKRQSTEIAPNGWTDELIQEFKRVSLARRSSADLRLHSIETNVRMRGRWPKIWDTKGSATTLEDDGTIFHGQLVTQAGQGKLAHVQCEVSFGDFHHNSFVQIDREAPCAGILDLNEKGWGHDEPIVPLLTVLISGGVKHVESLTEAFFRAKSFGQTSVGLTISFRDLEKLGKTFKSRFDYYINDGLPLIEAGWDQFLDLRNQK
jgi:hypothetical protein